VEKRTIADSLKPTFENVTREFITETMYKILFSEEIPNFRFDFREEEAIKFIEKTLQECSEKYQSLSERSKKVAEFIKKKNDNNETIPTMIINNYKEFFELLRKFYEKTIELYFERTGVTGFSVYEKRNCFENIWLRATPDDFNDPENFLRKQVQMINDNTFEKYEEETYIGKLDKLDNHIICVENGIARTWDETSREFRIIIYDKNHYNSKWYNRPHYMLPVIRYGIYEKDGKKVCYIGSIQNKNMKADGDENIKQKIGIVRSELSEGELKKENYKEKIEPTKTLALSIFIDFLNKEGITEIEAPSMYVLDYEYHKKRNIILKEKFDREWDENGKESSPQMYKTALESFLMTYQKEDIISEIKTERMINNLKRMLYHYPKGEIKSYPGELDNFIHLSIPKISSKEDINGEILKDIYCLVDEKYRAQVRE